MTLRDRESGIRYLCDDERMPFPCVNIAIAITQTNMSANAGHGNQIFYFLRSHVTFRYA